MLPYGKLVVHEELLLSGLHRDSSLLQRPNLNSAILFVKNLKTVADPDPVLL
jgi:hypothetical protein